MALNWGDVNYSDPNLYLSGAGTGMGILSSVLPMLMGTPGAFQARQAARQAGIEQNAAKQYSLNKEAQLQALSKQPLDPSNYYNMLGNAVFGGASKAGPGGSVGVDPIQRAFMANATSSWGDPSLAARTYSSEYLPLQASNLMNQAMGYANTDRSNQMNAIQWSPALQAMLSQLGPGTQMQYAQLMGQNQPKMSGAGDTSALASYFQNQSTQQNQRSTTQQMMDFMRSLQGGQGGGNNIPSFQLQSPQQGSNPYTLSRSVSNPGSAYTSGLFDSASSGGGSGSSGTSSDSFNFLG